MADQNFGKNYNERLFEKPGIRSYFHNSRFNWFNTTAKRIGLPVDSFFELGCFDGRLLQHIPFRPKSYVGFDADWEGGLSEARAKFQEPELVFEKSDKPEDLRKFANCSFDTSVSMETMEHLPPDLVDSYIAEISRVTREYFIVTVPNEKGLVFFFKYLFKRLFLEGNQPYSFSEFLNATLGRMHKIQQDDHKGFDYDRLIMQISSEFEIVKVESIPFTFLPNWAGFTIGIVARKRRNA